MTARKRSRVATRKYMGDDLYSWAVFVDGRVKWTGLSKWEAYYYRDIERKRIGEL
jgi:hypothetical protein